MRVFLSRYITYCHSLKLIDFFVEESMVIFGENIYILTTIIFYYLTYTLTYFITLFYFTKHRDVQDM